MTMGEQASGDSQICQDFAHLRDPSCQLLTRKYGYLDKWGSRKMGKGIAEDLWGCLGLSARLGTEGLLKLFEGNREPLDK